MRKICVVTGTRAEYGLMSRVMKSIQDSPQLRLQLIVTGAHLSPDFGSTHNEITADGFTIDHNVEMLLSSDSSVGVAKSMGLAILGLADALADLGPDMVLILGDRYEALAAASTCLVMGVPVAHLHGGELTEGAIDDSIRHSITKMASIHFVAADPYRRRVLQLGEEPSRVFVVGGLGTDAISDTPLMSRAELEDSLGFDLRDRNLLITYHPETSGGAGHDHRGIDALLNVLAEFEDFGLIFTMPNSDEGNRVVSQRIQAFAEGRTNVAMFDSLGQQRYLSCLAMVDCVVGNSSSGIAEAPSFGTPTVNIGDRQKGRLRAVSVLDCRPNTDAIRAALVEALTPEFRPIAKSARNPYGDGGASEAILRVLTDVPLQDLNRKRFHDMDSVDA